MCLVMTALGPHSPKEARAKREEERKQREAELKAELEAEEARKAAERKLAEMYAHIL